MKSRSRYTIQISKISYSLLDLAKSRFVFGIASPDDLVRALSSKVMMTFCVVQLGMCLKTSMTAIVPSLLC